MNKLEENVINVWGDIGRKWFQDLSQLTADIAANWSLSELKGYPNLSYNFVASAQQNNKPVVLKVYCDKNLLLDEHKALHCFAGQGSIKILDIDTDNLALLLEQARPGKTLKAANFPKIIDKIDVYANLVSTIVKPVKTGTCFSHVSDWCLAIDRIQADTIDAKLVRKAKELRTYLLNSISEECFCHGDLHLDNILSNENEWLAIDPKGIIAEVAFEAAAFAILSDEELEGELNLTKRIIARNHTLATKLDIPATRLLGWIFLRLIISAQWSIEDNMDPSKSLAIAKHIYPLLK